MATQNALDAVIREIVTWKDTRCLALAKLEALRQAPPEPPPTASSFYIQYPPPSEVQEQKELVMRCNHKLSTLAEALKGLADSAVYDGDPS